jgi:indole-3-glycerol phosphate synthase
MSEETAANVSILQKIGDETRCRVEQRKLQTPHGQLVRVFSELQRRPKDFVGLFMRPGFNVIAEIKKASPSKGDIAPQSDIRQVAGDYLGNGAAALSVLTEPLHFKGDLNDLVEIRAAHPEAFVLQKDFIVDPYQLYEACLLGADAVLLIVALLGAEKTAELMKKALALGLSVLTEVHNREELKVAEHIGAELIGVNNRNLKDLSLSLDVSFELISHAPRGAVMISESGIESNQDLVALARSGYQGFLVGSSLMRTGNPGAALRKLIYDEG